VVSPTDTYYFFRQSAKNSYVCQGGSTRIPRTFSRASNDFAEGNDSPAVAGMWHNDQLLVLPSLEGVRKNDGRIVVTQKFIDGMAEYARLWDGPVKAILEPAKGTTNNLDNKAVVPASLPFGLELMSFRDRRMQAELAASAVVLGGTHYRQNHLAAACRKAKTKFVVNTEYTLATREQIAATEEWNPLRRWRRAWWERSQEKANVAAIRAAAGVQCNGLPTYQAYRGLNENAMLYFDTRTTADMLPDEEQLESRLARLLQGEPLRLVFSGRLIAMKGADHLPPFAAELRRLGVPFTFSICGAGDLEDGMRTALAHYDLCSEVLFHGTLDFKTQLMPHLQQECDLFICPHRQGDPSCTYLETLACGVPIVGYANEAWTGLMEMAGCGRKVSMDDFRLLALAVARLHEDRETLAKLSLKAWDFAKQHTFEQTFARRIEHLRQCAGLEAAAAV
jgi:colanic acid/amylovoran biosynthesis glycosyltransferase